jgi:hypothetical protein
MINRTGYGVEKKESLFRHLLKDGYLNGKLILSCPQ